MNTRANDPGRPVDEDTSLTSDKARQSQAHAPAAECLYLYYLRIPQNPNDWHTRVYFVDWGTHVPSNRLQTEIGKVLEGIAAGTYKPCGWRIGDVKWRRRAHLAFLFDDPIHKLDPNNPVTFNPAHAFFSGSSTQQFPAPFDKITGYYCTNHMIKKNGQDVDEYGEPIHVHVNHSGHTIAPSGARILGHEDSGTNLGPPVPPP